ncbi:MAG: Crp/Fnr family transcriptional regulator [Syntrophaceae bacterium]|nr:Crp/Fnr family transcriptional regulator [Syntrophaceae bacterium]
MDTAKQIREVALFEGIGRERMNALATQVVRKPFRPGDLIIGEEDPARAFYVILSGRVKLYKSSAEGKEQTLYVLGPGEPFGLCTAFAVDSFPASAMALEEGSLLVIPGPVIEEISRQEPSLLLNIIRVLSRRLRESMALVESLSLMEIPQRLATYLLSLKPGAAADSVALPITQRELAKILGATPEALSRAIKKMSNEGLLRTEGRVVRLLDRPSLVQMAEGS